MFKILKSRGISGFGHVEPSIHKDPWHAPPPLKKKRIEKDLNS